MKIDAIKMANDLEKYYEFNKQFPQTAEEIVAMLRHLAEENKALRKQLISACNELMEKA